MKIYHEKANINFMIIDSCVKLFKKNLKKWVRDPHKWIALTGCVVTSKPEGRSRPYQGRCQPSLLLTTTFYSLHSSFNKHLHFLCIFQCGMLPKSFFFSSFSLLIYKIKFHYWQQIKSYNKTKYMRICVSRYHSFIWIVN